MTVGKSNSLFQLPVYCGLLLAVLFVALGTGSTYAGVEVSIEPSSSLVTGGGEFDVDIFVTAGSTDFNGFDLTVGYNPSQLTYVGRPLSTLPGQLLLDACASTPFHLFEVSPDSTFLSASYIMLCSGTSAVGPGVVYTLRFRAKYQSGSTDLQFLTGTQFYDAGVRIVPLVTTDATVVIDYESAVSNLPIRSDLNLRATPNPFNPATRLSFDLPEPSRINLEVIDARGRRVRTLDRGWRSQGELSARWNGTDDQGRRQPGGMYLFVLDYSIAGRQARATLKTVLLP